MLGIVALASLAPLATWYGPVEVSFQVQFGGNPYNPAENDVVVRFTPPAKRGEKPQAIERLAYFDETSGSWKAHLITEQPGEFKATLIRNGQPLLAQSTPPVVEVKEPLRRGFLRVSKVWPSRFQWDDGSFYYPLGQNVGWAGGNVPSVPEILQTMGTNGMNWTRIWACHWDGKNLWWPNDEKVKLEPRHFWPDAIEKWDAIAESARKYNVGWQWVLFHHGPWSTRVNSNWGENPWSKANGGWLERPDDFFTDAEAKSQTKQYLRYVVARYAHEPNLIAWELFNEVEWVDPRYSDNWKVVLDWHKEMADELRKLDPYKRLVTTSSTYEFPGLYEHMDYDQPHSYSPDPRAPLGRALTRTKPAFFGEFGTEPYVADREKAAIRRGILASVTAGHSGAAAYWYWDRTHNDKFYPLFARMGKIIRFAGIPERPDARPAKLTVTTPDRATLKISPEIGWGASEKSRFRIPEDGALGSLPISSYIQSIDGERKAWNPDGIVLQLNRPTAGKVRVQVAQGSSRGGTIALVHGDRSVSKAFAASTGEQNVRETLELDVPAGAQTVAIRVTGADWVRISSIEIENAGMSAQVSALNQADWAFAWVNSLGAELRPVTIAGLELEDGTYTLTELDLDSDSEKEFTVTAKSSTITHTPGAKDVVWVLKRKP